VVAVAATYIITVITFGIETCLGQPAMKLQNSVSEHKKNFKKRETETEKPAGWQSRDQDNIKKERKTADWFLFLLLGLKAGCWWSLIYFASFKWLKRGGLIRGNIGTNYDEKL